MYKFLAGTLISMLLYSCGDAKSNVDKKPDTVRFDSIYGNEPEDTFNFKLSPDEMEEEEKRDEEMETPLTPQEG